MPQEMNYFTAGERERMDQIQQMPAPVQEEGSSEGARISLGGGNPRWGWMALGAGGVLVASLLVIALTVGQSAQKGGDNTPVVNNAPSAVVSDEGDDTPAQEQDALAQQDVSQSVDSQPQQVQEAGSLPASKEDWQVVLAAPGFPLSADFVVETAMINTAGFEMDARVVEDFQAMDTAARQAGINLQVISGYRSVERQENLYQDALQSQLSAGLSEEEARQQAQRVEQKGGESDHNTGLAVDLLPEDNLHKNQTWIAESPEFAWLMEHGEEYGFILRYPEHKQEVTGVEFKPWHWRYVGKELATFLNEQDLTLDEYWQQYLAE